MPESFDPKIWLKFAETDYRTAIHLYENFYPPPLEIICYHCQQAIEKFLKAIILMNGKELVKTHDLNTLIEILDGYLNLPENYQLLCSNLTVYATVTRYPSEIPLDEVRAGKTVNDTKIIYDFLKKFLESEEETKNVDT